MHSDPYLARKFLKNCPEIQERRFFEKPEA
jgi:hypothetical protein